MCTQQSGLYYGRFFCRFRINETCQENDGGGLIEFTGPVKLELDPGSGVIQAADGSTLTGKALQIGDSSQSFDGDVSGALTCDTDDFVGEVNGEFFGSGGSTSGEMAGDLPVLTDLSDNASGGPEAAEKAGVSR